MILLYSTLITIAPAQSVPITLATTHQRAVVNMPLNAPMDVPALVIRKASGTLVYRYRLITRRVSSITKDQLKDYEKMSAGGR